jgi:hypothetical protein
MLAVAADELPGEDVELTDLRQDLARIGDIVLDLPVLRTRLLVRSPCEVQRVQEALGLPLRVVRLTVRLPDIEHRLASDVTSGRRDDLGEAASSIAAAEGAGVEDAAISNDRPIGVVARDVMTFAGWQPEARKDLAGRNPPPWPVSSRRISAVSSLAGGKPGRSSSVWGFWPSAIRCHRSSAIPVKPGSVNTQNRSAAMASATRSATAAGAIPSSMTR